jgi:hypothetical protein
MQTFRNVFNIVIMAVLVTYILASAYRLVMFFLQASP